MKIGTWAKELSRMADECCSREGSFIGFLNGVEPVIFDPDHMTIAPVCQPRKVGDDHVHRKKIRQLLFDTEKNKPRAMRRDTTVLCVSRDEKNHWAWVGWYTSKDALTRYRRMFERKEAS